jgi:hypothetical protein
MYISYEIHDATQYQECTVARFGSDPTEAIITIDETV